MAEHSQSNDRAGLAMTYRAKEFLDYWEAEHVEAVSESQKPEEARQLASACREDARRAGIAEEDLESAVGGDLTGNMLLALNFVAMRADAWPDAGDDAAAAH